MKKRAVSIVLSVLLAAGVLAGCASESADNAASGAVSAVSGTEGAGEGDSSGDGTASGGGEGQSSAGAEDEWSRAMAKRNQQYDPGSSELTVTEGFEAAPKRDYTLMLYMIGSNLESKAGKASADIKEIAAAGIDYSKTNVIAYTGGSRKWSANIPCDKNSVVDLSKPDDSWIMAQTKGNADMGAGETLTSFLTFCAENYPAEHYGLILWDHGAGPLWGYGSDELFDSDSLLLYEMDDALAASPFAKQKLDFVGFDACLMASVENMALWSDYAKYYVGSEELEPGNGWDYTCFSMLNTTTDPLEIVTGIVESYGAYYEKTRTASSDPDVTLASADLSKIKDVVDGITRLSRTMSDMLKQGEYPLLQQIRSGIKSFGTIQDSKSDSAFYYDLMDLGNFAESLKNEDPEHAQQLLAALEKMIVAKTANVEHSSGATMYFPFRNRAQYRGTAAEYTPVSSDYRDMLDEVIGIWETQKSRDWKLGELTPGKGEYTLTLNQDMLENTTAAYYTVIFNMGDGYYTPYLQRMKIEPDGQGVLHVPADPQIIRAESGGGNLYLSATQVEKTADREIYRLDDLRLVSTPEMAYQYMTADQQDVTVLLKKDVKSGQFSIQTINAQDSSVDFDGKDQVDVSKWEALFTVNHYWIPKRDAEGTLQPAKEWSEDSSSGWDTMAVDGGFTFSAQPVSSIGDGFSVLVELEDNGGEYYSSEMALLNEEKAFRTETIPTERGEMTAEIYSDHAEITRYNGSDTVIEVPAEAGGVPVTVIGGGAFSLNRIAMGTSYYPVQELTLPDTVTEIRDGAFNHCIDLTSVHFPKNLKTIGPDAFAACGLTSLSLPDSVEEIGRDAFAFNTSLTEAELPAGLKKAGEGLFYCDSELHTIRLKGASPAVALKDGLLYSADGKKLLAVPAALEGTVTVAQGTEEIAFGAAADASFEEIMFPESLKKIGNYAFFDSQKLRMPDLPDGLSEIGMFAFGCSSWSLDGSFIDREEETIHIGRSLETIGTHAFDGISTRVFAVDPENESFAEKDGSLVNLSGDALLYPAVRTGGVVFIPEGIRRLGQQVFRIFDSYYISFTEDHEPGHRWMDLVIPDSVTTFPERVEDTRIDEYLIHCNPGSAAEEYAKSQGIAFDHNMDPRYRKTEAATEQGTLSFLVYADHACAYRYAGSDASLVIPEEVEGVPVTEIGDGSNYFFDTAVEGVTSLTLPENLKRVCKKALAYASLVQTIHVPDTLEVIEESGLAASFRAEDGLPSSLTFLGDEGVGGGFLDENGTLTIPASLTELGPNAFKSCYAVSFAVEEGNEAFTAEDGMLFTADKKTLIACGQYDPREEITVPEGVEVIGPHAFQRNWNVKRILLPDSLVKIGAEAFGSCWYITEMDLPDSITEIAPRASYDCKALAKVHFPKELRTIGASAFSDCDALAEVELPEGLRTIGDYAFSDCTGITRLVLPDSLVALGQNVFEIRAEEGAGTLTLHLGASFRSFKSEAFGFTKIGSFTVSPENPEYAAKDGFLTDKSGRVLVLCPAGKTGTVTVPEGTERIGGKAFYNCAGVTDVVIPESVTGFGTYLFRSWGYEEEKGDMEAYRTPVIVHCKKGSAAEQYCLKNQIKYVTEDVAD